MKQILIGFVVMLVLSVSITQNALMVGGAVMGFICGVLAAYDAGKANA